MRYLDYILKKFKYCQHENLSITEEINEKLFNSLIGIILMVMGFLAIAFALPSVIEGDSTFVYIGFGLVILGGLLNAFWFVGKLRGRW